MNQSDTMDLLADREKAITEVQVQTVKGVFTDDSRILLVNGQYPVDGQVFNQLCDSIGVPATFIRRTKEDLAEDVINRLSPNIKKTHLLVNGADVVRVFNKRLPYTKPTEVARTIFNAYPDLDDCSADTRSVNFFQLNFNSSINVTEPKVGDVVRSGVNLRFSEFGLTPPEVEAASYRLICLNGMVHSDYQQRIRVNAKLFTEMMGNIIRGIGAAREIFATIVAPKMAKAAQISVDPMQAIRRVALERSVDKAMLDRVMAAYAVEPEPTMWGVSNAFTRAANQFSGYKERQRLQLIGGSVVHTADRAHCTTCAAEL